MVENFSFIPKFLSFLIKFAYMKFISMLGLLKMLLMPSVWADYFS